MSRKRRNTSSPELESHSSKRRMTADSGSSDYSSDDDDEQPSIDPNFGQIGAFPGLGVHSHNSSFYGPAHDGLDYLRMVRSEAKDIPLFLTSAVVAPAEHSEREYKGFFDEDEAFVGGPSEEKFDSKISKTQSLYYDAILDRFRYVQASLRATPPLSFVQALHKDVPISFPPSTKLARTTWEAYILGHAVTPVQVACMDLDSVFELIRLVTKKMRRVLQSNQRADIRRAGSWAWALLARCPDRGELGSEEIADLRACAKAADHTGQRLHNCKSPGTASCEDDKNDTSDEEIDSNVNVVGYGETTDLRDDLQKQKIAVAGSANLHLQTMILDMILTVVGEIYGQRDLLELRRPWGAIVTDQGST